MLFRSTGPVVEAAHHRLGHVAHVHGLEAGLAAAQHEDRGAAGQGREKVEEAVLRAEHHRRPECGDVEILLLREQPRLALALGTQVLAGRIGARTERASRRLSPGVYSLVVAYTDSRTHKQVAASRTVTVR